MQAGIVALGGYTTATMTTAGDKALVWAEIDKLVALIPDPNTAPAQSGGGALDEMSPVAASTLLVELAALRAAIAGS